MTIQNCVISLNNADTSSGNNGGGIYVKYELTHHRRQHDQRQHGL